MASLKVLIFSLFLQACFSIDKKSFSILRMQNGTRVIETMSTLDLSSEDWLGYALLDNSTYLDGWYYLTIVTNPILDDEQQVYTGGYLEGYTTNTYIYQHWYNTWRDYCDDKENTCQNIDNFFQINSKWLKNMMKMHSKVDPWWHHVNLYFRQLEGIFAGYQVGASDDKRLSWHDIFMMNMKWDLETLTSALDDEMPFKTIFTPGSCSAIIKILPDFSDLLVAHNTWTSYSDMIRAIKLYNFTLHTTPLSKKAAPGSMMSFTSYPGSIISGDDFYILSSGLVAMETTNEIKNKSLYSFISPQGQVMSAIRSMVANRLAESGEDWVELFSKMNSGTYNNQWMITDYKMFNPGSPLKPGAVWISEQMPGSIMSKDVTPIVNKNGYWASYNIPFIDYIYNISGLRDEAVKFGDWYSHDKCPRGRIFKRDHNKVNDIKTMMDLMRYNDYQNDPFSQCKNCNPQENACNAIAARCDLNSPEGSYPIPNLRHRMHGAIDAKVTNRALSASLEMYAVSGPTPGNGLPKFQWSHLRKEDQTSHLGITDLWDFKPVVYKWAIM